MQMQRLSFVHKSVGSQIPHNKLFFYMEYYMHLTADKFWIKQFNFAIRGCFRFFLYIC